MKEELIMPPFGFSGGMMRFEPASLLLWIDEPKSTIKAHFEEILRIQKKIEINPLFFHKPMNIIRVGGVREREEEFRFFLGRLRHETDHLRRYLSCSYGLFCHFIQSGLPVWFFKIYAHQFQQPEGVSFPLLHSERESVATTMAGGDIKEGNMLSELTRTYLDYLDLERCLNGDKRPPNILTVPLAATCINQEMSQKFESERRLKESKLVLDPCPRESDLIPFFCIDDPFCPQVFGIKLGARQILEALAFKAEVSFGVLAETSPDKFIDLAGMHDYSLLTEFWFRYFGSDQAFSTDALYDDWPSDRHLQNNKKSLLPLEFIACADLALWMPVTPYGFVSPSGTVEWYDIHPGWRFIRACHYLHDRRGGWEKIPYDLTKADKTFREIQNQICDALGWYPVDKICYEWLDFLEEASEQGHSRGFHIERGKKHPRYLSSLALLARRISLPYRTSMGYVDLSSVTMTWFPLIMARNGDLESPVCESLWKSASMTSLNKSIPYFLIHGTRFFAEGVSRLGHIPPRHFQAILPWLAAFGKGVADIDPKMFLRHAHNYLEKVGISLPKEI